MAEAAFVEMGMMDKGAVFRRRRVKGVEREPGAMQICCTPWRVTASRITAAQRRLNALTDMKLSGIKY